MLKSKKALGIISALLGAAASICLWIALEGAPQHERKIWGVLSLTLYAASIINILLFLIKPEWFGDKTKQYPQQLS